VCPLNGMSQSVRSNAPQNVRGGKRARCGKVNAQKSISPRCHKVMQIEGQMRVEVATFELHMLNPGGAVVRRTG